MRDRIAIEITSAFINVDPEVLEAAGGDPIQAAQNELGFTGLDIIEAEVNDFLDDDEHTEGDVVSLDAHPELTDEDAV